MPSLLPVLAPIVVYFAINWIAGSGKRFAAVGALLLGVIVGGLFVAISMTAGGGAMGQCQEVHRRRQSRRQRISQKPHKAAVTGDTVGDPYKDTAGPAVNPMIKITNWSRRALAGFDDGFAAWQTLGWSWAEIFTTAGLPHLTNWQHPNIFCGEPLVAAEHADAFARIAWLVRQQSAAGTVSQPVWPAPRRRSTSTRSPRPRDTMGAAHGWCRLRAAPRFIADRSREHLRQALERKRRKELQRKRRSGGRSGHTGNSPGNRTRPTSRPGSTNSSR